MTQTLIGQGEMLGLTNRFRIEINIDGADLGSWSKCEGLKVDFKTEKRASGGQYAFETYLPKQVEYGIITLTRAMTAKDSPRLQAWLAKRVEDYADPRGNLVSDEVATITLYDAHGQPIMSWTLYGVRVESWTGPVLDANAKSVAVEVLKLNHEGFLL